MSAIVPMKREQRNAAIALCAVVAFGCVAYLFNPSEHTLIPCWFHALTGYECAGCGLTRAAHALMHGNIAAAWQFNHLSVVVFPAITYTFARYLLRVFSHYQLPSLAQNTWVTIAALCVVLGYTVFRNL